MKKIALINYGAGNIRSVQKALAHVIQAQGRPFHVDIVEDAASLAQADIIVLPGQGAFQDCMKALESLPAMIDTLNKQVLDAKKPFLGICVGMQLLAEKGMEHGDYDGLGWIKGTVRQIETHQTDLKLPHMGWNILHFRQKERHFVVKNQKNDPHFYFVHSFVMECEEWAHIVATAHYGQDFPVIVAKENIVGIQCHPEKSQEAGLQFLHDFLLWGQKWGEKND